MPSALAGRIPRAWRDARYGESPARAATILTRVRIAVDIDSTLHHYWDVLARAARRRFGIDLPYDEQLTWRISRLRPEQVAVCVEESHTEQVILAADPYPGAVEAIRTWYEQGHFIHITSHRAHGAADATSQWLDQIALPYHELYCSWDKVSRCNEIGIDLLIDDSPVNIARALELGIRAATIEHPWNRDICEEEDVVCAPDWPTLARKLDPIVNGRDGKTGS
jgi:uncharacterized HAD superfamily protein